TTEMNISRSRPAKFIGGMRRAFWPRPPSNSRSARDPGTPLSRDQDGPLVKYASVPEVFKVVNAGRSRLSGEFNGTQKFSRTIPSSAAKLAASSVGALRRRENDPQTEISDIPPLALDHRGSSANRDRCETLPHGTPGPPRVAK